MFEIVVLSATAAILVAVVISKRGLEPAGTTNAPAAASSAERLATLEQQFDALRTAVHKGSKTLRDETREVELKANRIASDVSSAKAEAQSGLNRTEADVTNLRLELRTVQTLHAREIRVLQDELERILSLSRVHESRLVEATTELQEEIRSRTTSLQTAVDRLRPGASALARADHFAEDLDLILRRPKQHN